MAPVILADVFQPFKNIIQTERFYNGTGFTVDLLNQILLIAIVGAGSDQQISGKL